MEARAPFQFIIVKPSGSFKQWNVLRPGFPADVYHLFNSPPNF